MTLGSARSLALGLLVGSACLAAAGCAVTVTATTPVPNVIPAKAAAGTFKVDTAGVPATEVCSSQPGLRDLCVSELKQAVGSGLQAMLGSYIKEGAGPAYTGVFRLVELSHSPAS